MGFIVKNTTLTSMSEMLCPHTCRGCGAIGSVLCECCKKDLLLKHKNYCPQCKQLILGPKCQRCALSPTIMVGWRDELIGELIHDFKYNSVRAIGRELAELLDRILPKVGSPDEVVIVPLPTIRRHVRERGLDHTFLVAKHLAKKRNWRVERWLERAKNTVQVGADEKTRKIQAEEAYRISNAIRKRTEEKSSGIDPEKTYLLLDDVWTTGASMRAAVKKLREIGAKKIIIAVLAVSRKEARS